MSLQDLPAFRVDHPQLTAALAVQNRVLFLQLLQQAFVRIAMHGILLVDDLLGAADDQLVARLDHCSHVERKFGRPVVTQLLGGGLVATLIAPKMVGPVIGSVSTFLLTENSW